MNNELNKYDKCSCCNGSGIYCDFEGGAIMETEFDERIGEITVALNYLKKEYKELDKLYKQDKRKFPKNSNNLKRYQSVEYEISELEQELEDLKEKQLEAIEAKATILPESQKEKLRRDEVLEELIHNKSLSARKRREYETEIQDEIFLDDYGRPFLYDKNIGDLRPDRKVQVAEYKGRKSLKDKIKRRPW